MQHRKYIPLLLLFGFGATRVVGQVAQPPDSEILKSEISNVEFFASNYGVFGLDPQFTNKGLVVPRGSRKPYLYGSGIWFGARKQVSHDGGTTFEEEKLSFICYNPNTATSWATPGEFDGATPAADPILYHSTDYNQMTGTSIASASDPNWPLWLLPGEWTDPFYPGTFVPRNADRTAGGGYSRPAFMWGVHEQFFSRYHDGDLERYEIGEAQARDLGYPLGLQIQENVYAWSPGDPRQNVVILQYEITNISNDELRDCHIAQIVDFDIGAADNDRMTFYRLEERPELHTGIAWTEAEPTDYGVLAMVMLEAPVTDGEGFVDPNRRRLFLTDGRVGAFRNWSMEINPATPEERYDFMAENLLDADAGPGDRRALMGTESFHMAPGDRAYVAFAFAVLEGVTVNGAEIAKGPALQAGSIPELEGLVETLHEQYYETGFQEQASSTRDPVKRIDAGLAAEICRNAGSDDATLRVTLGDRADLVIRIVDNLGRVVGTDRIADAGGTLSHRIDLHELESGSYLVSVEAGVYRTSLRMNVVR